MGAAADHCHEAQMEPARNQSGGRLEIGGVGEDKCPSFPFTLGPAERASPAAVPTVETVITF